ncbi:MAG: AsmA-like C-terminal region-containing protein [Gallionella sp.]|jgi:hypothetical protein
MNEKIVFVRTSSGEDEVRSRTAHLSKDIKRALLMVDGTATVAEIMRRSSPSLRGMLEDMFNELVKGGFIKDKAKAPRSSALVTPSPLTPKNPASDEVDELDFTAAFRVPTQAMFAEEAARVARVEAERQARQAEQAQAQAQAAERARLDAADEAARLKAEQEVVKSRALAEAARLAAEQEAARVRAESARREKAAAETTRIAEQARAEAAAAQARLEAEVARLKAQAEAEARARIDAEKRAKQVAEAARLQAEQLAREAAARVKAEQEAAEAARLQAEQVAREAAARVKAEQAAAEAARLQAEQVAREAAARVKAEQEAAEAARLQAEQLAREAVRIKAEQEAAEARVRVEAERYAKEAAETRAKAEQHAAEVRVEAELRAKVVAQEKDKLEAEVAKLKALAETETQARLEAAAQAKAEAARAKVEQEAAREAVEQMRAAEAARVDAERMAMQAEAARVQAEHDAAIIRVRAEEQARAGAAQAEFVASEAVRAEAARLLLAQNQDLQARRALEAAAPRDPGQWVTRDDSPDVMDRRKTAAVVQGCDSRGGNNGIPVVERRTTTAAVLFFDIVGYTKQSDRRQIELKKQFNQLVTDSLDPLDAGERIILDTGDGAAIGFLQHPTDALESAMHFREALVSDRHYDALRVRIGIHLGPVSLVKDMNGQINMLGDGINSAQRVMCFAGQTQIFVSRAYFEFVSNLSDEYNDSFRYRGAQQDKHGREHQVYELLGADLPPEVKPVASANELADFNFDAFNVALSMTEEPEAPQAAEAADQLLLDAVNLTGEAQIESVPVYQAEVVVEHVEKPVIDLPAEEPQYTGAEARELADAQARKWEEAKLRASDARQAPRKVFEPPVAAAIVEKPVALPPRKPLPWGRLGAGLFVLLLAALFVVPAVLPMQAYLTGIEQSLSAKLKQPVHIGHLEGRILPAPRLLLTDVSIGDMKQIKVKQAQVGFSLSALFGQVKPVSSLELDGVEVNAFSEVSGWLQQLAGDHQYPVARILLTQGTLDADGIGLTGVNGQLDFDPAGKFSGAKLNANAHKLELEIHATPEQKLQLVFSLHEGALPSLPNWVFEDLKATGELSRDELRITDLDGRIMGGALTGDVRINWRAGWRVQGALAAKVIPLQNINKLLSSDLDGTARFQMQAKSLDKLADAAILNGVFNVRKGLISGVDVVETARLRSRESLPGGRTHFEELSGELFYANDVYQFRPVKMNDSVVKVAGALTVNHQQLSGNVIADLALRAGSGSVALQIGGTTESPSLHAAH